MKRFSEEIPLNVLLLVERGYSHKESPPIISDDDRLHNEQRRNLARRWRNLVGELKFDLAQDLWRFVNMSMPKEWHKYRNTKIKHHVFTIELPSFLPIMMEYRQFPTGSDWYFYRFLIKDSISSTRYEDLPLFLAVAHDMGEQTKKEVKIEEIQVGGNLADNATVIQLNHVRVLTDEDFMFCHGHCA